MAPSQHGYSRKLTQILSAIENLQMAGKFEAMWQDAADRFLRETGKSIRQNPPVTLQECTATIERSQQLSDTHEPEEQSKTERAKGAGLAIIQCLNAFGGIATLAAQMTV